MLRRKRRLIGFGKYPELAGAADELIAEHRREIARDDGIECSLDQARASGLVQFFGDVFIANLPTSAAELEDWKRSLEIDSDKFVRATAGNLSVLEGTADKPLKVGLGWFIDSH